MSLTGVFVEFVLATRYDDLPSSVRRTAARCLLDHLGCVVGGMETELGTVVARMVRSEGGSAQATLVSSNHLRVPATAAALANGTAANALDYDDTLVGHPGCTVIAAALASAELAGSTGKELLSAIVAGYEVCSRINLFWQPAGGRFKRVWDTATLQTFGAVAAAGQLLDLTRAQLHHAFGIAAATAPMPRVRTSAVEGAAYRPMLKSTWGWAAQAGLRAALLARAGMTGQREVLDGETLIWQVEPPRQSDLRTIDERLGETFLIEQVEFKPYPCCRFLHSTLDALSDILASHPVTGDAIADVQVAGFDLLGDSYHYIPAPSSHSEAEFSLPFCAAALLVHRRLQPAAFSPEGLSNPQVLALAKRIKVTIDPEFQTAFPTKYGARVTLKTRTGNEWTTTCEEPRGSVARPLDDTELIAKFSDLAATLFSPEEAARVAIRILNLEQAGSVRDLMDLF